MKYINQYLPGIAPGIFPNEGDPDMLVVPTETFTINGNVVFFSTNEYQVLETNDNRYRVNITRESGHLYFTEKDFKNLFRVVKIIKQKRYAVLSFGHLYMFGDPGYIKDLDPELVGFFDNKEEADHVSNTFRGKSDYEFNFVFRLPKAIEKRLRKKLKKGAIDNKQCANFIYKHYINNVC